MRKNETGMTTGHRNLCTFSACVGNKGVQKRHTGPLNWTDTLERNIRMDFEEIGISAGNWVDSAQDRNYWRALVSAALNLRVMELVNSSG